MSTNILEKAAAFYEHFERKGATQDETTHYCPGCGHGNVHKLIAEAIDDMQIGERTVFVSPVGCSVFAYYYFNTGNVQAAHGRAPAVGTAVKRTHPHSIVISYQGDGDLASIGGLEILHAANRGENMTVFFINNAIYGMTGGQMAPTSLIGQKTSTSPYGRHIEGEGYPMRMCEIISTLEAPVYVERCHLADAKGVMATKKAVHKALKNQVDGKGFSFVEILSPCPTGWKMSTHDSLAWIKDVMIPYFPVKVFKDESATRSSYFSEVKEYSDEEIFKSLKLGMLGESQPINRAFIDNFRTIEIKFAGFGGQGVLTAGAILASLAMQENLEVSWIPSYGPEKRGGTANSSVVIGNKPIGSPLVVHPDVLVCMNIPSLDTFEDTVVPGGLIIVNQSIIARKVKRTDVKALYIPLSDLAADLGLTAAANMILLGALLEYTNLFPTEHLKMIVPFTLKHKHLADQNIQAVEIGAQWIRDNVK